MSAIGRAQLLLYGRRNMDINKIWQACLTKLENELTPQQFNAWIKSLAPLDIDGDTLRIAAPNRMKLNQVKKEFGARITSLVSQELNSTATVSFVLEQKAPTAEIPLPSAVEAVAPKEEPAPAEEHTRANHRLVSDLSFETLVTGKANQLARAAAIQVADNPGASYNPLFIYGSTGLGKTHLVHAIGNQILAARPDTKIRYLRADHYVNDVVTAYQRKGFDDLKRYYHSLDVLLIDDIQFIGGNKVRTQEEFFYAFEALIAAQKQIVITSDTYPKELSGIDSRLTSRFDQGLTVAIEPPELEMRVAILQKKGRLENKEIPDDVAFFVAKHLRSNVRELEGALSKIMAYSTFHNKNVSIDVVKDALKDLLAVQNRQISVENIQKTVADFFDIKIADMYSKRRPAKIVRPRQIAMYLAKELTQKSLPEIGALFGGRDHTTVLHAVRKVALERGHDPEYSRVLHVLEQTLKG